MFLSCKNTNRFKHTFSLISFQMIRVIYITGTNRSAHVSRQLPLTVFQILPMQG